MAKYSQTQRGLAITTPLGADVLLLVGCRGVEALSQLFSFQLDMLAEKQTRINYDAILGQKVTVRLTVPNGSQRYLNGIIRSFSQGKRDDNFTYYHAELAPQLWFWTKKVRSRIFQQMTVPDILKAVLQGIDDVHFELTGQYAARDYCVQYRESDFAFASRLMEEEGIGYFFKHSEKAHELVVADSTSAFVDLPWPAPVTYEEVIGGKREDTRIHAWNKRQEVSAGKFTLSDYCFELPSQDLGASQNILDSVQAGAVKHSLKLANADLEISDHLGMYAKRYDGVDPGGGPRSPDLQHIFSDNRHSARIHMEREAAESLAITGDSNCMTFAPGMRFTLTRHYDGDGVYHITRVEHSAKLDNAYRSEKSEPLDYTNEFACIPKEMPYRPTATMPRPIIPGPQTATVVGPSGQDVFTDKYGRVKVQFHWDKQGKKDASSSCWVRVAQVWAGKRWGAFFWPRVGQEVVVMFEEGDPDQPIIVGSVYNSELMPPFELPANELVTGIKSCSAGSDSDPLKNYNGILFYDKPGEEHVQIHSERNETFNTESSKWMHIGQSHTQVVGGLGLPGSGSGGGSESNGSSGSSSSSSSSSSEGSSGEKKDGPVKLYWEGDVLGSWAKNLNFTVGIEITNTLGRTGEYIVGDYIEVIINPLGLLAQVGGAGTLASMARGLGATFGAVTFVIGSDTTMVYGPEVNIHRGAKYEFHDHFSIGWTALAALVGGIAIASNTLGGLFPSKAGQYLWGFIGAGAAELALAILTGFEIANAQVQAAEKEAAQGADLAEAVMELSTLAIELTQAAERRAIQAGQAAAAAAGAAAGNAQASADAAAREATNHNKVYNGNFSLAANDIVLRSTVPPLGLLGPGMAAPPPTASSIIIDAQGGGEAVGNGVLLLNGTGVAGMKCGPAYVAMKRLAAVGQVMIEAGPAGSIKLHQGLPDIGPMEVIAPQGICLSVGAPGEGASVMLTALGVKMQFAEWFISITAEGITLSVGENTFTMGPQGVNMNGLNIGIVGDAQVQVNAPMIEEVADGEGAQNWALAVIE